MKGHSREIRIAVVGPLQSFVWAAKSVLVMVKYEAAESIRKATLLLLVGVDEGSLMEVSHDS